MMKSKLTVLLLVLALCLSLAPAAFAEADEGEKALTLTYELEADTMTVEGSDLEDGTYTASVIYKPADGNWDNMRLVSVKVEDGELDQTFDVNKNLIPDKTTTVRLVVPALNVYGEWPEESAPDISITPATASVTIGSTKKLTATVTFPEGYAYEEYDIVWESSDDNIATVKTGEYGAATVTGVARGTADITATLSIDGEETEYTATAAITVTASSGGGGGGSTATVTKTGTTNGSYTLSSTTAATGDTVKITPKANSGYEVDTVTATDKNGNAIAVTKNADGTYSFTMPAADLLPVKTAVTFKQSEGSTPTPPPSKTGFVDVDDSAYYADAVAWAIAHDPVITNGTDSTHFSPDASCTRAQMVTFLWRAAGQPAPAAEAPFTDVAADAYYAQAVAWAYASGITKGTSETEFSPDATVTRAQVVTLLYRYEQASATGGANPFTDVAEGAYYYDAVLWANANNITNGTSATTFSPDSDCTRAQIVTFLYRDMVK